jgi:hypothetical protein
MECRTNNISVFRLSTKLRVLVAIIFTLRIDAAPQTMVEPSTSEVQLLEQLLGHWVWEKKWLEPDTIRVIALPRPTLDQVFLSRHDRRIMLCSDQMNIALSYFKTTDGTLQEIGVQELRGKSDFLDSCGDALGVISSRSPAGSIAFRPTDALGRIVGPMGQKQEPQIPFKAVALGEGHLFHVKWPDWMDARWNPLDQPDSQALLESILERFRDRESGPCGRKAEVPSYGKYSPAVFVLFTNVDCSRHIIEFARSEHGSWTPAGKYTSAHFLRWIEPKIRQLLWKTVR